MNCRGGKRHGYYEYISLSGRAFLERVAYFMSDICVIYNINYNISLICINCRYLPAFNKFCYEGFAPSNYFYILL